MSFLCFQSVNRQNGSATFTINKADLKDGVAQITLFNENRQAVCERLYFKRPENKMVIHATAGKATFNERDNVNIDLSTSDQWGNLLDGNLSASVYRLDDLHRPANENIFSYLWLSSELKEWLKILVYYFQNDSHETNEALDNLLLTQGWHLTWIMFLQVHLLPLLMFRKMRAISSQVKLPTKPLANRNQMCLLSFI